MKLTGHFYLQELMVSHTADINYINNYPTDEIINNLRNLCIHILEPARIATNAMIHITSGYRCEALNKLVGGASSSQHVTGCAADLRCYTEFYNYRLVEALKKTQYDQLILEQKGKIRWIHVSWSKNPRNQIIDNWKSNYKK